MFALHNDRSVPTNGEIFVYGSNLGGIHGAGAAREAFLSFGAVYGNGIGLHGNSYGIPTKDEYIQTIDLQHITPFINEFVRYTHDNPQLKFWVTRIGCGLAGYQDNEIAPLFKLCNTNCSFATSWKDFL